MSLENKITELLNSYKSIEFKSQGVKSRFVKSLSKTILDHFESSRSANKRIRAKDAVTYINKGKVRNESYVLTEQDSVKGDEALKRHKAKKSRLLKEKTGKVK